MVQTGLLESPFRSAPIVVGPPRTASKRLRNLPVCHERFAPRESASLPWLGTAPTCPPRLGAGCDRCHTTRCDPDQKCAQSRTRKGGDR